MATTVSAPPDGAAATQVRALALLVRQQVRRVEKETTKLRRLSAQLAEVTETMTTDTREGHGEHDRSGTHE